MFIFRLLKASTKLKLLDLRGSSSIKCHTIQCLPATDLQQLYLSLSSVAKYTGIEIIMAKVKQGVCLCVCAWGSLSLGDWSLLTKSLKLTPFSLKLCLCNRIVIKFAHVCAQAYTHMHTHTQTHAHACMHTNTHANTHLYIYTHIQTHTQTHTGTFCTLFILSNPTWKLRIFCHPAVAAQST